MQAFNVNPDDFNKLSLPKRKFLEKIKPILETIDLNKLNQTLSKIEISNKDGEWVFNAFIVPKEEKTSILEIGAGGCVCRLRIDGYSFYLDDGAPDEDLFSDENIKTVCDIINRLLKGFTIIESLTGKGRVKKKVYYYGVDENKKKMETGFPSFLSPFLITRSVRERKYILV